MSFWEKENKHQAREREDFDNITGLEYWLFLLEKKLIIGYNIYRLYRSYLQGERIDKNIWNAISCCNSLWENLEDVEIVEAVLLMKLKVMETLELSNL